MPFYSDDPSTKIRTGGLRYQHKPGGSSFTGMASSNMSCLLCGKHRPRSQLRAFKLAGAPQYRC